MAPNEKEIAGMTPEQVICAGQASPKVGSAVPTVVRVGAGTEGQ